MAKRKKVPRKLFFELLLVVALLVSAAVGVYAVRQRQNIERSGAAVSLDCSSVSVTLTTDPCSDSSVTDGRNIGCYDANGNFIRNICAPKGSLKPGGMDVLRNICRISCEAMVETEGGGGGSTPAHRPGPECTIKFDRPSKIFAQITGLMNVFNPGESYGVVAVLTIKNGNLDHVKFEPDNTSVLIPNPVVFDSSSSSPFKTTLYAKGKGVTDVKVNAAVVNENGKGGCSDSISVAVK